MRAVAALCSAAAAAAAYEDAAWKYQLSSPAPRWTVLNDTDFNGYNLPGKQYGPGSSAEDCADQCKAMPNCVAISWNGPHSQSHDGNCNFKCSSQHPSADEGEFAVVVRPGVADTCSLPPPPPPPPAPPTDPDWLALEAAGHLFWSKDVAALMPFVGNGYLATHPVHKSSGSTGTLFVGGLFNGVAVPFPCDAGSCGAPHRARVPTYRVTMSGTETTGGYALDVERAVLMRRHAAGAVKIECRHYAHLTRRHVLVHEIALDNSAGSAAATITLSTVKGDKSGDIDFADQPAPSGTYLISGLVKHAETPALNKTLVALAANVPNASVALKAGEKKVLYFVTAVATSLDSADPTATATSELAAALSGSASLLAEHETAWAERWAQGHMEVSGNLKLAQAVNASMYFILSSVRADWPQGLSPGGLASDGYNGHSFWDCETWMWPNLLLLQPDSALSALQYRIDRQEGARAKAKSYGYVGLMYPWESAYSGYEVQGSAGNKVGPWGQYEQHITGDVAFAAAQYWQATGDTAFLKSDIEPLLRGIADFWASRVVTGDDGKYHINHVMCPDEYHSNVDDSVYTNWVAVLSLRAAVDAAAAAGRAPGANWSHVADGILIPFDEANQFHAEYKGYTKGTKIKQADAILLAFPYLLNMTAAVRANDLNAYASVTDANGPAMTWAMFALGWLEAGDVTQADSNFLRGYANIQEPFKVWTETPHGGTVNFITGAGGFLQSVLYGYSGMRLLADRIKLEPPAPPKDTDAVRFAGVNYRGSRLDIVVTADTFSVAVMSASAGAAALTLVDDAGGSAPLRKGAAVSRPRSSVKYAIVPH